MTVPISNVVRRVVFAPSGTGPYAFTFEILAATDIQVYKGDTLLTLTTDYTVTINTNGTGSVTLVATAGTDNITIVGARTIQRTTDFVTGGDLFANSLNDELDSLTIFTQQNAEAGDRSIKAPVTDPTNINMTLPTKTARAGKYLSFNSSTGNPETTSSVADVTTVAANVANINAVAGQITPTNNISTVAGQAANISATAGSIASVVTVAGIASNVTAVAGIAADVTTVAANIVDIQNAEQNADDAIAAKVAAESARDATLAAYDNFDDRYLGAKASDPSLDNDGNALVAGSLYFNTGDGAMKVYTGSAWVAAYISGSGFVDLVSAQTLTGVKTFDNGLNTDTISEETSAAGVTIDGVLLKDTTVTANTIKASGTSSSEGRVELYEDTDNGTNYVALKAPASVASNVTFTMPSADGTDGQVMQTNGSGALSFKTLANFSGSTIHSPSATSLTLTSSSTQVNVVQFTDEDNHIVTLPDATTLSEGFPVYRIINHSTIGQAVEVRDSAGALIQAVPANEYADIALTDNSTAAGTWHTSDKSYLVYGSRGTYTSGLSGTVIFSSIILRMTDTSYIYFTPYRDGANNHNSYIRAVPVTINSNGSFTYGTEVTSPLFRAYGAFSTTVPTETIIQPVRLSDTSFVVVVGGWRGTNVSTTYYWGSQLSAIAGTLSSGTITFGTWDSLLAVANASGTSTVYNNWLYSNIGVAQNGAVQRISDTTFLLVYNNAVSGGTLATSGLTGSLVAYVGTVSGTTISYGSPVTLGSTTYTYTRALFNVDTDKFVCLYQQYTSGGATVTANYKAVVITLSGTTPTWATPITLEPSGTRDMTGQQFGVVQSYCGRYGNFIFPSTNKIMFSCPYYDSAVGYYGNKKVIASISGTTLTRINEQDVWAYSVSSSTPEPIYLRDNNTVLVFDSGYITANINVGGKIDHFPLQEWKFNPDTNLFYRTKVAESTLNRVIQKPSLLQSDNLNFLLGTVEYYYPLFTWDFQSELDSTKRKLVQSGYYDSRYLTGYGWRGQLSLIEVSK